MYVSDQIDKLVCSEQEWSEHREESRNDRKKMLIVAFKYLNLIPDTSAVGWVNSF